MSSDGGSVRIVWVVLVETLVSNNSILLLSNVPNFSLTWTDGTISSGSGQKEREVFGITVKG